jgi:hypothetical protein
MDGPDQVGYGRQLSSHSFLHEPRSLHLLPEQVSIRCGGKLNSLRSTMPDQRSRFAHDVLPIKQPSRPRARHFDMPLEMGPVLSFRGWDPNTQQWALTAVVGRRRSQAR